MRILSLLIAIALIFANCKENTSPASVAISQLGDADVQRVLNKAWASIGGWDAYQNLDSISYKKHTILYNEDGSIETESRQVHSFQLKPTLAGQMVSADGMDMTVLDDTGFYKTKNGTRVAGSEASAKSSILSSHFVLFAPFKITDPGTEVDYVGIDRIGKREVEVLRARWNPDQHANHSTDDTWYLHFDVNTGEYLSYLVYHAPTYALINNLTSVSHQGLIFATSRETWRVDSLGNPLYLRGEFAYEF